jgi:Rieske Fe-S protein
VNARDPHWKTDFSVDWDRTSYLSRREFTRYLALGSLAMAAGSTFMALRASFHRPIQAPRLPVLRVNELPVRGTTLFEYPAKGHHALLISHGDGTFDAFSQKCTHLGCSVFYGEESGQLECPCHEGFFDARTGAVLAGPPQRPLPRVTLEVADGTVYATGGGET